MAITINGTTGLSGVDGSAGTPALQGSDPNTGIYSPGANQVAISTNGTGRLFVDSTGKVGLGTSSPGKLLHLSASNDAASVRFTNSAASKVWDLTPANPNVANTGFSLYNVTDNTVPVHVTNAGNVGIGTASPQNDFVVSNGGASGVEIVPGYIAGNSLLQAYNRSGAAFDTLALRAGSFSFQVGGGFEKARIDSSGRLLVGTPSESGNAKHVVRGNTGSATGAGVFDIGLGTTRPGGADVPLGYLRFTSTSNTGANYHYASIAAMTDGTSSSDTDIPGRLVFYTTADGASAPTWRMVINSSGGIVLPADNTKNNGFFWQSPYAVTNYYGLYEVSDGIMWRAFSTARKLIGRVGSTGGVQLTNGATSWSAYTSESRLKDIVGDCDYDQAWSLVRDIELKRYFYKDQDDEFKKGVSYLGPMADWLEAQDPELVVYQEPDEDGPVRTFNQGLLDMKALAALSAALKRIETLEASNADLAARLTALEGGAA